MINRATIRERSRTVETQEENKEDEEDEVEAAMYKESKEDNHMEDESLQFTGRLFGGLVQDVKRKLPWYISSSSLSSSLLPPPSTPSGTSLTSLTPCTSRPWPQ